MSCLSRIDINLQELSNEGSIINLYLDGRSNVDSLKDIRSSSPLSTKDRSRFSETIQLPNREYICYHLSSNYDVFTIYTLQKGAGGKVINVHLPTSTMNGHLTHSIMEYNGSIVIDAILKDSSFITITLPLEYIFGITEELPYDWINLQSPYDFTVRKPHMLYPVNYNFFIVFLEDGGLMGLKQGQENYLESIIFSDISYIQVITKMFSRRTENSPDKVVSCSVFENTFLIVLTQKCHLKIWSLETYSLIQDINLTEHYDTSLETVKHENCGNYLNLWNNILVTYLPIGNGIFEVGQISITEEGVFTYLKKNSIKTNLKKSSIWSLVDAKMSNPLDLNVSSTTYNIIVLWKSGNNSKLQILNIKTADFKEYEWIESFNKSMESLETEEISTLIQHYDFDKAVFKLKSSYSPTIYKKAEKILESNNISEGNNDEERQQYLANLETLLRDIKNNEMEVSSLTIYKKELILINTYETFNHSIYKINSSLENTFFNIFESSNEENDLSRYLKLLHGFFSTVSRGALLSTSGKFIDIVVGKYPKNKDLSDIFTEIYRESLEAAFDKENIQLLFNELSSYDLIQLLNDFIENHLREESYHLENFIEALVPDATNSCLTLKGLDSLIIIQHKFVKMILLSFLFLDFDINAFGNSLHALLDIHYKQALFLNLYQLDKKLLLESIYNRSGRYSNGIQIFSYSEFAGYLEYETSSIYNSPAIESPLVISFISDYVLNNTSKSQDLIQGYQRYIAEPFYQRNNLVLELLYAMSLFNCGKFEQSYEFFTINDYTDSELEHLPNFIRNVGANSIWFNLIQTLQDEYKRSSFYFELSRLFKQRDRTDIALQCISKSVEYSMKNIDTKEPPEFSRAQHLSYLDLLINFDMFAEILDVLRMSQDALDERTRMECFQKLLNNHEQGERFFTVLLRACDLGEKDELLLCNTDYNIIDGILKKSLEPLNWNSYQKLFSFRIINNKIREAAELIYEYLQQLSSDDYNMKLKCYLMVMNILKTLDDDLDQWFLNSGKAVTLADVCWEYDLLRK
ncbi:Nup120p RNJ42_02475 [Nakaseomyces bracarensis]|uniref:Nup120p n=1 Tax=Nakaseomyces bracarensis TaxID=273131 RepID=UPI0038712C64